MSAGGGSRFDRVRPRTGSAATRPAATQVAPHDSQGKRALFSAGDDRPAPGTVVVECSACGASTAMSPLAGIRAMVPSLHVWPLRRHHPSYLRCPACGHFAWSRVRVTAP